MVKEGGTQQFFAQPKGQEWKTTIRYMVVSLTADSGIKAANAALSAGADALMILDECT